MSGMIIAILVVGLCLLSILGAGVYIVFFQKQGSWGFLDALFKSSSATSGGTFAGSAGVAPMQTQAQAQTGGTTAGSGGTTAPQAQPQAVSQAQPQAQPQSQSVSTKTSGKVIAENARITWYSAASNDPPGSRNCAYTGKCQSTTPISAAHAADGSSPYKKGALYTISGKGGAAPICVKIDDTCSACKGDWIDVFREDNNPLPYDFGRVTEGC